MRKSRVLMGMLLFVSTQLHAGEQVNFTIVPTIAGSNRVEVPINGMNRVTYKVTNNRPERLRLTIKPIIGVIQETQGEGVCTNPFSLAKGQSCLLILRLTANQLAPVTNGGPVICRTTLDFVNIPDDALCSQPDSNDALMVTVVGGM